MSASVSRRGIFAAAGVGAGVAAVGVTLPAQADQASGKGGHRRVRVGADVAAAAGWSVFKGRRIGVITNPTGILSDTKKSIVDVMAASGAVDIGAVFGPEHGFRGATQAGESEATFVDERTGVTVYDAYGANADKFAGFYAASGIDTVVFDIQDVGVRFYTYIWTMYDAMIAAIKTVKSFIVLDRPNPIGGACAGPMLTDGFSSGVGKDKILLQHGMTVGEVARYFNGELMPKAAGGRLKELKVVNVQGWSPDDLWVDTGLTWVMPSPNMPTADTALLYPGTGLFEAVTASEGRGTTRPFELIGAPFIEHRWTDRLAGAKLPGVAFREAYFQPTISKFIGEVCAGTQVLITDPHRVDALRTATTMLTAARDLYAPAFTWRALDGATPGRWIGLLTGSKRFQTMFEAGASAEAIVAAWQPEQRAFDRLRRKYLLYRR